MTTSITQLLLIIIIGVFFFGDLKQLKKKINIFVNNSNKIKNKSEKKNTRKKGT